MKSTSHSGGRRNAVWVVLLAVVVLVVWRARLRQGLDTGSPSPGTVQIEERLRPDSPPGREARPARAVLSRDTLGDGPKELGAGQTVDSASSSANPEDRMRRERHHWVKLYLTSPARGTEAFAQIEALCREYGYGPWAVGPAYHYAWDMAAMDRLMSGSASETNDGPAVFKALISEQLVIRKFRVYGDAGVPADFLAAVGKVRPAVFFGHSWEGGHQRGEALLDALSWEEVEAGTRIEGLPGSPPP